MAERQDTAAGGGGNYHPVEVQRTHRLATHDRGSQCRSDARSSLSEPSEDQWLHRSTGANCSSSFDLVRIRFPLDLLDQGRAVGGALRPVGTAGHLEGTFSSTQSRSRSVQWRDRLESLRRLLPVARSRFGLGLPPTHPLVQRYQRVEGHSCPLVGPKYGHRLRCRHYHQQPVGDAVDSSGSNFTDSPVLVFTGHTPLLLAWQWHDAPQQPRASARNHRGLTSKKEKQKEGRQKY